MDLFSGWLLYSFFLTLFYLFYYFLIFKFLIIKIIFILITLSYFILFSFFLSFFLPSHVADRNIVLQPAVWPVPLRWESRVQDIGPPETSRLHVRSNSESSPRDLHLNAKTQLHSTTSKLQCWTPYIKQLARQEHNHTH